MRSLSLVSGFRIAAIVLALSGGRALAGFTDLNEASGATITLSEEAVAGIDESDSMQALTFDVAAADQPAKNQTPPVHPQMDARPTQTPVAAPLPVALLPGGVMIAASFVATRVFKRRIV